MARSCSRSAANPVFGIAIAVICLAPTPGSAREQPLLTYARGEVSQAFGTLQADRAQAAAALPGIEKQIRMSFKAFPAMRASALSSLAEANYALGSAAKARALNDEALATIKPLRAFFPSEYVDVKIRNASYLLATGRPEPALASLREAAETCAATFADISHAKRAALAYIAAQMNAAGDTRSATKVQALADRAGTERRTAPSPMGYVEERRTFWRGELAMLRHDFGPSGANPAARIEKLRHVLGTEFDAFPVEKALGHIEIGEVALDGMWLTEARRAASEARAIVTTGREHFADVELSLIEFEGRLHLADLQLEQAALAFATAWRMASELMPPDSPLIVDYYSRIASYLMQAARPRAALVLLGDLEKHLANAQGLQSKQAVWLRVQYAVGNTASGNLADAETAALAGLDLTTRASYDHAIRPLPGDPELTPEQLRSSEQASGTGRYERMHQIRVLHGILADIYLRMNDSRRWLRNVDAALGALREFPGESTPEYLAGLDGWMFACNQLGFVAEARTRARELQALAQRHPEFGNYAQRARMVLDPQYDPETFDEKVARLRREIDSFGDSPVNQARVRIILSHVLRSAGRAAEAETLLKQAMTWRDLRAHQQVFSPDPTSGARNAATAAMELSLLMGELVDLLEQEPQGSARHATLLEEAFRTAQALGGATAASVGSAQLTVRTAFKDNPAIIQRIKEYQLARSAIASHDRLIAESFGGDASALAASTQALERARASVVTLGQEIRELAGDNLPDLEPLALADAQHALRDDQALVLYFVYGPVNNERPHGYAFVVTTTHATVHQIVRPDSPHYNVRLPEATSAFRRMTTPTEGRGQDLDHEQFNGNADGAALGKMLYDVFWAPIAAMLSALERPIRHVVIVPDLMLENFQFGALVPQVRDGDATEWLIERHALSYLPSVRALAAGPGTDAGEAIRPTLVALGDPVVAGAEIDSEAPNRSVLRAAGKTEAELEKIPSLPEASDEVCALALQVGGLNPDLAASLERLPEARPRERCRWLSDNSQGRITVLTGPLASKSRLLELSRGGSLSPVGILAFATHGLMLGVDEDDPALLLSPAARGQPEARFLSIADIVGLDINADLVLLSACRTADTGGIAGASRQSPTLAAAFMQAGARSVLATLSSIKSKAAEELVSETVQRAVKPESQGLAIALQSAALTQIRRGKAPWYWSPLILYGAN